MSAPAARRIALVLIGALSAPLSAAAAVPSPTAAGAATPAPAASNVEPPVPAAGDQRSLLDTSANGVDLGILVVVLRGSDVLLRPQDLDRAGVDVSKLATVEAAGSSLVSIASIAGARFTVDVKALSLSITLPVALFRTQRSQTAQQLHVERAPGSGFINYAVGAANDAGYTFDTELGANVGGGFFDGEIRRDATYGGLRADGVSQTYDDPVTGRRTIFGTTSVNADDFAGTGGGVRLLGVSVTRDGPLDRTGVRFGANSVSGVAASASTLEIYVDGQLVQREQIDPGAFELSDLPLRAGLNDTTVVVRDAYGNTQTIARSLYSSTALLQPGEHTYAYSVGREIDDRGDIGNPIEGVVRYAYGATQHVTVGARAMGGGDVSNVGAQIAVAGGFGQLQGAIAASEAAPRYGTNTAALVDADFLSPATLATPAPIVAPPGDRLGGEAGGIAYSYLARDASAGLSYYYASPYYASLEYASLADRATNDFEAFAERGDRHGDRFTLAYEHVIYRDQSPERELSGLYERSVGPLARVAVGYGIRSFDGHVGPHIIVRGDVDLSRLVHASVESESRDGGTQHTYSIDRVRNGATGLSFGLQQSSTDGLSSTVFDGDDLLRYGDLQLYASRFSGGGGNAYQITYAGGIAHAGGAWFATQPITGAFGVVDAGAPNVDVLVNGEDVGSTDARGRLIATNLFSYGRNQIGLQGSSLPPDVIVDGGLTREVIPAYRGGNVVRYPARRVRVFVGKVRLAVGAKSIVPALGKLVLDRAGFDQDSDLGRDGAFYFETLKPGLYDARLEYDALVCHFKLDVPVPTQVETDLGTLECKSDS